MFWCSAFLKVLRELVDVQEQTLAVNRSILKVLRLRKPGVVFLRLVSEEDSMLKFVLMLPAAGAADVVTRRLVVKIGDAEPTTAELAGDAVESVEMSGEENAAVVGSLVDVDDAGNESEPSTFSFVLLDTIAPPQPGAIGLKVTAEE
jgi:hypothetical protein